MNPARLSGSRLAGSLLAGSLLTGSFFTGILLIGAASASRAQTTFDPEPEARGLLAEATRTAGQVFGLFGVTASPDAGSAGLLAESTATSGVVFGLVGTSASAVGGAGFFTSLGGGPILRGVAGGVTVFEVSATGEVIAGLLIGDGLGLGALGGIDCTACVNGSHLASGAVLASKLAAGAVGSEEIAADAVGPAEIAANAVRAQHLDDGIVDSAEIADGSVFGIDIALNTLDTVEIADEAVTQTKIAPNTIRRSNIDGSERLLYETHPSCPDAHVLTFKTTCTTTWCGVGNDYLDCDGDCALTSPTLCVNPEYGYIIGADIHPF